MMVALLVRRNLGQNYEASTVSPRCAAVHYFRVGGLTCFHKFLQMPGKISLA
jgi:hypothetical protein